MLIHLHLNNESALNNFANTSQYLIEQNGLNIVFYGELIYREFVTQAHVSIHKSVYFLPDCDTYLCLIGNSFYKFAQLRTALEYLNPKKKSIGSIMYELLNHNEEVAHVDVIGFIKHQAKAYL